MLNLVLFEELETLRSLRLCENQKLKLKITAYIENNFNRLYWTASALVFLLIALRAFFIPFSHDETATFFYYVQPDDYLPYSAHVYTNNHVLNSFLANIFYHTAGSHRFVLRLPNVLSFILLCAGVYKHFKYLRSVYAKLVLATFFLFTINFLDFFEVCRGYGVSFGLIVLGFSFLMDYFHEKKLKDIILFSVCLQLAVAANLILIVLMVVLLFFIFIFQARNKLLFTFANIHLQVINILLLYFWVRFSFFYKEHGALDYGVGDNYWQVTFKTLMLFIFGTDAPWMQVLVLAASLFIAISATMYFFRRPVNIDKLFDPRLFYAKILGAVVVAFWVQKKLLDVNLPEDRTGVFFYILFVLCLAFAVEMAPRIIGAGITLVLLIPSFLFFVFTYNLHDFSSWYYHTIPKEMYELLKAETGEGKQMATIGGHRVREMDFAFLNYRGNSVLNPMDDAEQMIMNCDYYLAMKREQPYYKHFYDEIAQDVKWDRALLKRKEKIQRKELYKMPETPRNYKDNNEFFEFVRLRDSVLKTHNCIEAEIEIKFNSVPKPLRANLVLQVNDTKGGQLYYKRVPLNWLADDLSGQTKKLRLTTGALPANTGDVVIYVWNFKQSELDFTVNEIKIFELNGKGVNFMIPDSFYKYLGKISNQSFL